MTRTLLRRAFWLDAIERAIKTVAQTISALLVTAHVVSLVSIDWGDLFSVAGLAGFASVLTSVASSPVASSISPASLIPPGA